VNEWQAAQAVEFIRALQVQVRKMTSRLAWVEREGVTDRSSREMRLEAAALRRDIQEARLLIDRLQRRYPYGNMRTEQRRPRRSAASGARTYAPRMRDIKTIDSELRLAAALRRRSRLMAALETSACQGRRPPGVTWHCERTGHAPRKEKTKWRARSQRL
jgi:hypothetical protein